MNISQLSANTDLLPLWPDEDVFMRPMTQRQAKRLRDLGAASSALSDRAAQAEVDADLAAADADDLRQVADDLRAEADARNEGVRARAVHGDRRRRAGPATRGRPRGRQTDSRRARVGAHQRGARRAGKAPTAQRDCEAWLRAQGVDPDDCRVADLARVNVLWAAGEIGWPRAALADWRLRAELRLIRNQLLACVGHKPGLRDQLPPFDREYPLIAASLGLAPDPDRANAQRLVGTLAALSAAESTRVGAP